MVVNKHKALSMIEIVITISLVALALGPSILLLSTSNRASTASLYEVMAVHYANEIFEQLNQYSGMYADIIADIRNKSGNTSLQIDSLLTDTAFTQALETYNSNIVFVPFQYLGTQLKVGLWVSPLHPNFTKRRLIVQKLNNSGLSTLLGEFWDIKILLSWKQIPTDAIEHNAEFSIIIRE